MVEVNVLEFGYSFETERHFVKFLIKGLNPENTKTITGILDKIPEGKFQRFKSIETENGLNILELFPENEYPFNSEIPTTEEITAVEDTVKGFLGQVS
jgi:hypothetical protein